MKKVLTVLLTALVLFGCSSSKEIVGGDMDNINDRGYIIVAMEGTWAPWTFHDEADNLVGFDVEVAKAVAEKLGVDFYDRKLLDHIAKDMNMSVSTLEKYDCDLTK